MIDDLPELVYIGIYVVYHMDWMKHSGGHICNYLSGNFFLRIFVPKRKIGMKCLSKSCSIFSNKDHRDNKDDSIPDHLDDGNDKIMKIMDLSVR